MSLAYFGIDRGSNDHLTPDRYYEGQDSPVAGRGCVCVCVCVRLPSLLVHKTKPTVPMTTNTVELRVGSFHFLSANQSHPIV